MWVGMRTFLVAPHKIVSIRDNFAALFAGYFRERVLVGHWTYTLAGNLKCIMTSCMGNINPVPFNIPLKEVFEVIRLCLKNQSNL